MKGWRRGVGAGLVIAVAFGLAGCEVVRRKFIRNNKPKATEPIFALEQEYRPEFPPEVRYQAHFAYWKAAHEDLIEDLDRATVARRTYAAGQATKELQTMQALLDSPSREGLGKLLEELTGMQGRLANPLLSTGQIAILRNRLESLYRRIDKGYDYHRIKAHLKSDAPAAH